MVPLALFANDHHLKKDSPPQCYREGGAGDDRFTWQWSAALCMHEPRSRAGERNRCGAGAVWIMSKNPGKENVSRLEHINY